MNKSLDQLEALLTDSGCLACQALMNLGVTLEKAKPVIAAFRDPPTPTRTIAGRALVAVTEEELADMIVNLADAILAAMEAYGSAEQSSLDPIQGGGDECT